MKLQVRLPLSYDIMPPGAIEDRGVGLMFKDEKCKSTKCQFKMRFHTQEFIYDFMLELFIEKRDT